MCMLIIKYGKTKSTIIKTDQNRVPVNWETEKKTKGNEKKRKEKKTKRKQGEK